MPKRLNRITRIIVMVAGLVVIGGSAVGGIALAATRSPDSPASIQPNTTPSAGDHDGQQGDDNKQGDEHATTNPSGTCTEDRDTDDVTPTGTGDRHGDAEAPDDSDHHGTATPTVTGSHHDDGETEGTGTHNDNDNDSSCDDD